jgi:ribulose kinase
LAARFSNAFGLPLSTPKHQEEAAFGSALFAMVAAGLVEDIATAQTRIQYQ